MAQANKPTPRHHFTASLIVFGILAALIGCGGGGSGTGLTGSTTGTGTTTATATGTGGTTATATASTTGTATATTGTATGTTGATATATGTTGGPITGILPGNALIYSHGTVTDTLIDYVSPDGSSDTPYTEYSQNYVVSSPNPQQSGFVFAYSASTSSTSYDIYSNKTTNVTGATQLTSSGFSNVFSLQYSPDAKKIIFVAAIGAGDSQLYIMNADGTGLHTLDAADDAYYSADNSTIAYTRFDQANAIGQIFTINANGTNVRQITNDTLDHFAVQVSKDGTRLTWAASTVGGNFNVYTSLPDGTQLNTVTNGTSDNAISPTFSPNGDKVGYVLIAVVDTTKTGIYQIGINGLGNVPVVIRSDVNNGLYWTSAFGTLIGNHRAATPSMGRSYHLIRLKKMGRWHW